jgi:hypothetical protein
MKNGKESLSRPHPNSPELPQPTTDPNLRLLAPSRACTLNRRFMKPKEPEHRCNKAHTCNLLINLNPPYLPPGSAHVSPYHPNDHGLPPTSRAQQQTAFWQTSSYNPHSSSTLASRHHRFKSMARKEHQLHLKRDLNLRPKYQLWLTVLLLLKTRRR